MAKTRADILLVEHGLFESRAKARAAIEAGGVTADGRLVLKPSEALDPGAQLAAEPAHPWVGRGGMKLARALEIWPIDVKAAVVLDVGASTGGFTEVCLAHGAARVYAVDVGRGQLHPKLAGDNRVNNLEALDARNLTPEIIEEAPGLVVCDISFISLTKALPAALSLARAGADLIALVKPQFEVGRQAVGRGGLVRDVAARQGALAAVKTFVEASGWSVRGSADSPILGGEGAPEYLLWATKKRPSEAGGFAVLDLGSV